MRKYGNILAYERIRWLKSSPSRRRACPVIESIGTFIERTARSYRFCVRAFHADSRRAPPAPARVFLQAEVCPPGGAPLPAGQHTYAPRGAHLCPRRRCTRLRRATFRPGAGRRGQLPPPHKKDGAGGPGGRRLGSHLSARGVSHAVSVASPPAAHACGILRAAVSFSLPSPAHWHPARLRRHPSART